MRTILSLKDKVVSILTCYLIGHSTFLLFSIRNNYSFPQGLRFLMDDSLPILLFLALFYIPQIEKVFTFPPLKTVRNFCAIYFPMLAISLLIFGVQNNLKFINLFNVKWSYHAFATWIGAIIIFFVIQRLKGTNFSEALLVSLLTAYISGVIYELPIYPRMNPHVGIWYHPTHPFFVSSAFILIACMTYYFAKQKPTFQGYKKIMVLITFSFLLGFSVLYASYPIPVGWLPRLPAIIFFAAFLYGRTLNEMKI